ncbi:MAG: hexokinase [Selenomonadaceae bacterium]|nr:hexokinase [Selenomonadaceae bacterium]
MAAVIDTRVIQTAIGSFVIGTDRLRRVESAFIYDLEGGVSGDDQSSLKMLPAFIDLPTGREEGDALALDFGGTNVRARLYHLEKGIATILGEAARPLRETDRENNVCYDYTTAETKPEELFDFIAGIVGEAVGGNNRKSYSLGWTFSFPARQDRLDHAELIVWAKEIAVPGVEGQDVVRLLREALDRRDLKNITVKAVINDTIATLIAAAYSDDKVTAATIYGTGHNTGCREMYVGENRPAQLINLESGGFSKLMQTACDAEVDARSDRPGTQLLEKMVSGRYLGELFTNVVASAVRGDRDEVPADLEDRLSFTARDMSQLLSAETVPQQFNVLAEKLAPVMGDRFSLGRAEIAALKGLAEAISRRSARLVAATLSAIVKHNSKAGEIQPQTIAFDGSVYANMPGVAPAVRAALDELLGEDGKKIELRSLMEGSGFGAAIAAIM